MVEGLTKIMMVVMVVMVMMVVEVEVVCRKKAILRSRRL